MKQKMKKCLCLMLSSMFVFSNCGQLFAQNLTDKPYKRIAGTGQEEVNRIKKFKGLRPEITLESKLIGQEMPLPPVVEAEKVEVNVISEKLVAKATEDMKAVKHSLENLEIYANRVLQQSQFETIDPWVLERYNQYLQEVKGSYRSLANRVDAYDEYLLKHAQDAESTVLERASRKYTGKGPRIVVRSNASIAEGAAIQTIEEEVAKVIKMGPEGVHYSASTAKNIAPKVNSAFSFLNGRLTVYDNVIKTKLPQRNEILTKEINKLIADGVLTRDTVLKYLREVVKNNPEEYRFLGVLKEVKAGSKHVLDLSTAWRQYLKTIASKRAKAPMLGLMRNMSYETLKSQLKPVHKRLINEFPELLEEGSGSISSRIAKKGLKVGPVAVIGAVLTATLITQVKGDNHFGIETVSNRDLVNLQRSIENNTAGIADIAMYYSNPQTDALVNKDVKHLINSVTMGLTLQEAADNFENIDNILSQEALAANYDVNEKLQNKLDEQLANITDKVSEYENMI